MDPISTAAQAGIGMGLSAISGIFGASGAEQTASANAAAARYKAGIALMNSRINKQNASFAQQAGDINLEEAGLKAGQEIASTKASRAASGTDVNTGTNAQVRSDQGAVAAFDQDVIAFDTAKTVYGYQAKAAGDEAQANLDYMEASKDQQAGDIAATASILSAGSSVADKWLKASTAGIFSSAAPTRETMGLDNLSAIR